MTNYNERLDNLLTELRSGTITAECLPQTLTAPRTKIIKLGDLNVQCNSKNQR